MGDDFNFGEWFNMGKASGMFDFSLPIFKDHEPTYEEAINFLNRLGGMNLDQLSVEEGTTMLSEESVSQYFKSLVDEDWDRVGFDEIGTSQYPGWCFELGSDFLTVYKLNGEFVISLHTGISMPREVLRTKTKEEAGSWVLKWILMCTDK